MNDPIKRKEVTHIDEVNRTAISTVQWFAEMRNIKGKATHPITHNNRLTMFICGQNGFADIAAQIALAKESIDLCCWGFDPGMELVRGNGGSWPRGETYGDLLSAAGKRGVKVRLLVWYDGEAVRTKNPRNMPGYSHGTSPWCCTDIDAAYASQISASSSVEMLENYLKNPTLRRATKYKQGQTVKPLAFQIKNVSLNAREEYCFSWYAAAMKGRLENVEIRLRSMDAKVAERALQAHAAQGATVQPEAAEYLGLKFFGSHHQKPILIDFSYQGGEKAVGYVMGLNSITDYWDTTEHLIDDLRRECGGKDEAEKGFSTLKPYQDYACRLDGGGALLAIHKNFTTAWQRANKESKADGDNVWSDMANKVIVGAEDVIPPALKRLATPGDCSVQIVRTQPDEQDATIREVYFQATDIATMAAGYVYVENQYFQYEDWSRRLLDSRRKVAERWKLGCVKAGMGIRDMPTMHVFVVIPEPEISGMVPRTYDALAVLGQHGNMTGQEEMIKKTNEMSKSTPYEPVGVQVSALKKPGTVVRHANAIDKPTVMQLETQFGLKVSVAMLNSCAHLNGSYQYREVYIHSKLMLIDDVFMTLGSANLNLRSMTVDSEINLATVNPQMVSKLRRQIWSKLSNGLVDGKDGSRESMEVAFIDWTACMASNQKAKGKTLAMRGFLLPLKDKRSSTFRLG